MTRLEYLKESNKPSNKPIEYKKVWHDNKVYLLPCDPKLVKIVLRSDTEPEFIYENDEFSKEFKGFEKYLNESIINKNKIDTEELTDNASYKRYHDDYYGLGESQTKIKGKRAECCVYDDHIYMGGSVYAQLNEILNSNKKENEDMVDYKKIKDDIFKEYSTAVNKHFMMRPQIVNYKYNETTGETTVYWDDKTQTTVKADNISEASQFEGFCAACAKKLFGNKSTYLNQFDKWTVKIPERERLAAEKKTAEDKAREEARAKRAAKKAERKRKRDIELRAKQLADMYYSQEIEDEVNKIANEKYGVPTDWLNN